MFFQLRIEEEEEKNKQGWSVSRSPLLFTTRGGGVWLLFWLLSLSLSLSLISLFSPPVSSIRKGKYTAFCAWNALRKNVCETNRDCFLLLVAVGRRRRRRRRRKRKGIRVVVVLRSQRACARLTLPPSSRE